MSARAFISFGFLFLAVSACTGLTEPGSDPPIQQQEQREAAPVPTPPLPPPPAPAPAPTPPPSDAANELIGASHILIAYKGSLRAAPTITRSKGEAQKLANTVLAQAKAGAKFGDLAVKYSDDPSAKQGQGSLGKFGRNQMVKPFADAAFALKPAELSSVVETPFGFHIIKRTE
jgi:parvulin-like peptidyl-prolyl isomerase